MPRSMSGRSRYFFSACALRCLLARLAVDPDGHGAVVRQGYLHIGAEATRTDGASESFLKGANDLVIEGLGDLGAGGTDVGWAVAFLRLRHEGELRHDDDVPADVEDAAVHHPVFVVEDAQLCGLLHEVLDVLRCVVWGDTDEDEHAEAVALGDGYSADMDGCGAGTLDEESHRVGILLTFIFFLLVSLFFFLGGFDCTTLCPGLKSGGKTEEPTK